MQFFKKIKKIKNFQTSSGYISKTIRALFLIWGWLARRVYANGRQFGTVRELQQAILDVWEECPQEYLEKLVNSMPNRIFQLIQKGGAKIDY